jgi:hypothetical protein
MDLRPADIDRNAEDIGVHCEHGNAYFEVQPLPQETDFN